MDTLDTQPLAPESGIYECQKEDRHLKLGDLVHVSHLDTAGVHLYHLNSSYTYPIEGFLSSFRYLPDGEARISERTSQVLQDIHTLNQEMTALTQSLSHTHIAINRHTGQSEGLDSLPIPRAALTTTKGTLLAVKDRVKTLQEQLSSKQKTLEAMMKQQMRHAEALLVPIRAMVEKLEEAVWTVELYLGRKEQIVQLRDGRAASQQTPITIRQQVLAMDQEAAVSTETGGIDSLSLEAFDQWVLADPAHLDQILPEPKGVVALIPRWEGKRYSNPWQQQEADEGNKKTCFLIRNGERLYRVWTDFFADRTLTPTAAEFLDLFRTYDHFQRKYVQMEPGSRAYMEAEKKRSHRQRDYMRVALILQGLIDRTVVFQPLPTEPLMVTDLQAYEAGFLQIIADAERTLLDGSERFVDWQKRINQDLEPGRRVLGNFGWNFSRMRDDHTHRHPRIWPDRAELPQSHQLYTIERRERGSLVFLYERTNDIWVPNQGYVRPERRASCKITPSDAFVLAFDHPDCTIDALQGFLHRRVERENYLEMFPLLKAALQLKKQEQAQEKPFRELMVQHASATLNLQEHLVGPLVDQAIEQYKFKRKVHRALVETGRETEAFRQVLTELEFLAAEQENRQHMQDSGLFDQLVAEVLHLHPNTVLIAHRKQKEFTVYVPETPDDQVFMRILTVKFQQGKLNITDDQRWRTIGKHHHRWHVLHQTDRLKSWRFYARPQEHLTDPEIAELGGKAAELFLAHHRGKRTPEDDPRVVAVTFNLISHQFRVYHHTLQGRHGSSKKERKLLVSTSRIEKTKDLLTIPSWGWSEEPYGLLPWQEEDGQEDGWEVRYSNKKHERVLFVDEGMLQFLQQEQTEHQRQRALQEEKHQKVQQVLSGLEEQWTAHFWENTRMAFMAEYGNMALWEAYQKMVQVPHSPIRWSHRTEMHKVAEHVVEHPEMCPCTVAVVVGCLEEKLSKVPAELLALSIVF